MPFALLSQAAYQRKPDNNPSVSEWLDADAELKNDGWVRWEDFPSNELKKRIASYHLRVDVWSNASAKQVAVAFGGTEFSNRNDWIANLRWFIPKHNDQYTALIKDFGPAFIDEFIDKRDDSPEFAFLGHSDTAIFSTGHSLGGGLAQEFAYSLNVGEKVPRVKKAYVFDPSPVTGFYSVEERLRCDNSEHLQIDRIYERGEILAILRSLEHFVYPDSKSKPAIRQVRYDLFSRAPITGHSIAKLAYKLKEMSKKDR